MPPFVPGVELARAYYADLVRPLLDDTFPGLVHSAALFGTGSEVLGYDTERSTDHGWGPRVLLFVADEAIIDRVESALDEDLPPRYQDWPTRFAATTGDPDTLRVDVLEPATTCRQVLGFDPLAGVTVFDWLSTPTQVLLAFTAGDVFYDGLDALEPRRRALAWYPRDVWLYAIGCQWKRVAQEEAFVGRTAEVGDDLGSRIVAARVVRDLMRLCFLLERRYAPYSKWLGHAFETLDCAPVIRPHLARALAAASWQRREAELGAAAEKIGEMHNALGVTESIDASLRPFYGRPFLVLDSERFAEAAFDPITDPEVAALPRNIGTVDQWVDSTDVLSKPPRPRRAATWYARPDPATP